MKKFMFLGLVISIFLTVLAFAGQKNLKRIAVAASGKTLSSAVSNRSARSPYYLIFDNTGKLIKTLDNPYRTVGRMAGPSAVDFLAQRNVDVIVAESFGFNMVNAMKNRGITYIEFRGTVKDAVKRVLESE
ncbi:MAG: NifB/NifX family molybdenum-iron cluster-binding protein [Deltaproteobacteria bacterium]|nr:NifB/NifX family molybdenum-iron cluster-binding protein [Candidatus Tharpellaceae bacterium]